MFSGVNGKVNSPWSFSLKPFKARDKNISGSVSSPRHYNSRFEFQPRVVPTISEISAVKDIGDALTKLSKRSLSIKKKEGTYSQAPSVAVASIPSLVFGYRNFIYESNVYTREEFTGGMSLNEKRSRCGQLVLSSVGKSKGMQLVCELWLESEKLSIISTASSAGMWKGDVKRLVNLIESALVDELSHEIQLNIARKDQKKQQRLLSKKAAKLNKDKELDKILHPEKYRNKSATVRRAAAAAASKFSDSAGGRYTPSSSAQARRHVRRGG